MQGPGEEEQGMCVGDCEADNPKSKSCSLKPKPFTCRIQASTCVSRHVSPPSVRRGLVHWNTKLLMLSFFLSNKHMYLKCHFLIFTSHASFGPLSKAVVSVTLVQTAISSSSKQSLC